MEVLRTYEIQFRNNSNNFLELVSTQMKITHIEVIALQKKLSSQMLISRGGFAIRNHTLVRVHTDSGISGLGEGIGNALLVKAILKEQMCELAVGQDPFNIEALRQSLLDSQVYFERQGSAICAASAIEIACWDIKGKALGIPVYQLLGGCIRRSFKLMPVMSTGKKIRQIWQTKR